MNSALLSLYSLQGQVLLQQKLDPFGGILDVANLASGIYFIKVQSKERDWFVRVVVE